MECASLFGESIERIHLVLNPSPTFLPSCLQLIGGVRGRGDVAAAEGHDAGLGRPIVVHQVLQADVGEELE